MVDFHIDVNSDQSDNVVEHDIVAWLYSRMKPEKNHTTAYHLEKARAQITFSKPSFWVSMLVFAGVSPKNKAHLEKDNMGYPPGKDHISHLGKFGKSSTQNAIFGGIC